MAREELDTFLREERTCRVATVGPDGAPNVAPLWFVWDGSALWLNSLVRSQRWTNLQRDARVAVAVDAGVEFAELRGVELAGKAEVVGDVPRGSDADPELTTPEKLFADKYSNGTFVADGRHAWLRIRPEKITSWDFRKTR